MNDPKPTAKPFVEIHDRNVYLAVYANPCGIYSDDGTRKLFNSFPSLDAAMEGLAVGILARLDYEADTPVFVP